MKLIIDIPYEAYYTFKCELENRKGNLNALGEIIAKGIPYEERSQGDLISREALKKALNEMFDTVEVMLFDDIIATIDNAPTVENITIFCENADEKTIEELKAEMQKAKLAVFEERPQKDIRWTDKLSVKSNGDIIDFEGRVVGHINLEDMLGDAE